MRALVFDLDDTLLNSQKRIAEENRVALLKAHNAGFQIVVATSRPMRAIQQFVDPSILQISIVISLNGSVAHLPESPSAPVTFGHIGEAVDPLLATLIGLEHGVSFSAEIDGYRFTTRYPFDDHELWAHHSATQDMIIPLEQLDRRSVTKLAVDGHGKELSTIIGLAASFPELRFIPAVNRTFLNIVPLGVDKSLTLQAIATTERLDLRRSYAFGDDVPDIEMFKVVGTCVAMGNAKSAVKNHATHIIGHCDTGSIADFIEHSVLR